jgi:hypothetical protein
MQNVIAKAGVGLIIANFGTITEAEALAGLLTNTKAGDRFSGAIAFREFVGIRIGFDGGFVVFGRTELGVLDTVSIKVRYFSAFRRFSDIGEAVPGNTSAIGIRFGRLIQDALTATNFILAIADLVPSKSRHNGSSLKVDGEDVVIKTVRDKWAVV